LNDLDPGASELAREALDERCGRDVETGVAVPVSEAEAAGDGLTIEGTGTQITRHAASSRTARIRRAVRW
jgi:hypothetical protein